MFSKSEYDRVIQEIETAKATVTTKSTRQYNLLKHYEIFEIAGIKKIIAVRKDVNSDIKYLVPYEEVFDAIERCHKAIGHKGRDAMDQECKKKHLNLTIELVNCNIF